MKNILRESSKDIEIEIKYSPCLNEKQACERAIIILKQRVDFGKGEKDE